jgi:hypothetical protein
MKKIITSIVAAGALAAALTACTGAPNAQQQEDQQQQQDAKSLEASQPIPHYNYSQIRQTLIDAETISADGTQTTSFFFQMGDADPVFSCPSLGMPVANTAQLSNPLQPYQGSANTDGSDVVAQIDPNGIYAPSASSGTYVVCVNGAGQNYLQYWEGDVMTVAAAAEWNAATHSLKVIGAPTAAIDAKAAK